MADDEIQEQGSPDLAQVANNLVTKHGSPTAALAVLLGETHKYRSTIRELKGQLPAEGSVVIDKDGAAAFDRYKALGAPGALEGLARERDGYKTEAEGFRREKLHAEAATSIGFKPTVLTRLATQDGLDLAMTDGHDKAGKPARVAVVRSKNAAGVVTEMALDKHAAMHWAEFLPSLKAEARQPQGGSPSHRPTTGLRSAVAPGQPQRPKPNLL